MFLLTSDSVSKLSAWEESAVNDKYVRNHRCIMTAWSTPAFPSPRLICCVPLLNAIWSGKDRTGFAICDASFCQICFPLFGEKRPIKDWGHINTALYVFARLTFDIFSNTCNYELFTWIQRSILLYTYSCLNLYQPR